MKLRIRGNTIRLRLTQSEVKTFGKTGEVLDEIGMGPDPSDKLSYGLSVSDETGSVQAMFTGHRITVAVPRNMALDWVYGDDVGFSGEQAANGSGNLSILVEKDFECLKKRPGEDESDSFPNPGKGAAC